MFIAQFVECWKRVHIFPNMTMLAGLTKDKYIVVHIYIYIPCGILSHCLWSLLFFKLYVKFDLMFPFPLLVGLKLGIITIACPLPCFQNHAHVYHTFRNNNKREKSNPKTLRFSWQIETFYGCWIRTEVILCDWRDVKIQELVVGVVIFPP